VIFEVQADMDKPQTFLGFDLSTQKLKAVLVNDKLETLAHAEVKFDTDLPEFRTTGGVNNGPGKNEFYVYPVMWLKALDMVLDRLVVQGADLGTVLAISGSAQQHGSVYWSQHGIETLRNLDADKFLHCQLDESAYASSRAPIWMDSSTDQQCEEMEAAIGGRSVMVEVTGSKCYSRFTGPQIRKMYQKRPDCYMSTARISLVSSFLASIFLGDVAPIDFSDASGMNLFDIKEKRWSDLCLNACAPDLGDKLGEPVPSPTIIGNVGSFFVQRYGIPAACKIVAFTGDNPSALAGMAIGQDWIAISLGTSDTVMLGLSDPVSLHGGHVLVHPTENGYMGLLCFRNGSLVRDIFRRAEANNNWEYFSELLDSTPRGNYGNLALHFVSNEIIPNVKGTLRWNKLSNLDTDISARGVTKFASPQTEIRALIEGQMLHRRAVASDIGFNFGENTKILATGGASANKSILQVMSDVFNAPVYTQKTAEAALLGAAFRARYGHYLITKADAGDEAQSYSEFVSDLIQKNIHRVCEPSKDSKEVYEDMFDKYRGMVSVLEKNQEPEGH